MVSEPTPTTSAGFGVTPGGGSAKAGAAVVTVITAAAVAAISSLLTIRTFRPPRHESGTRRPRVPSPGHPPGRRGQCRTGPVSNDVRGHGETAGDSGLISR